MTHPAAERPEAAATLAGLRRFLLVTFVLATLGVTAELLLTEHFEDLWQLAPLILFGVSLLVLGWYGASRSRASVRAFQGVMLLFAVSGVVGFWLHYSGNVEFEREMKPSIGGVELVQEAMMGATPALAPGTMILLAAVGLAFTYRHPAFLGRS